MAQLKDSTINGNLDITGKICLKTQSIYGTHPETGESYGMLGMSESGNTIIGYGGYYNQNGNSNIYGNDVAFYVASAGNSSFRPYYKAGDVLNFSTGDTTIKTSGYVTNSMKNVVFTIPISKPIIGSPKVQVTESKGMILRQNNNYTHGSTSTEYAQPTEYEVSINPYVGFVITACFDNTTNATNNSPIGIYWNGKITLL